MNKRNMLRLTEGRTPKTALPDFPTKEEIAAVLAKLSWSVHSAPALMIATDFHAQLGRSEDDKSFVLRVERRSVGKRHFVPLSRDDVFTKGKSAWLKDNNWRMTPAAIAKWSEDLEKAIAKGRPKAESVEEPKFGLCRSSRRPYGYDNVDSAITAMNKRAAEWR